jgi:SPP1 family predicted phage head-tail adaptor
VRNGRRDCPIVFQRNTGSTANSANEITPVWTDFCEAFAEFTPRRAAERSDNETKQRFARSTADFRVHYMEAQGVTADMRIYNELDGQYYNIIGILPNHGDRDITLFQGEIQDGTS